MALKQLILNKKITERSAKITQLRADETKLKDDEKELEVALDEAETDEDVKTVEESADDLEKKIKENADEIAKLEKEKTDLEDPNAKSAYQKVKNGLVTGCSFGFNPIEEITENREDGSIKWIVTKAEILEISTTVFPAYKDTNVEARHKQFDELSTRNKQKGLQTRKQQLKERIQKWH